MNSDPDRAEKTLSVKLKAVSDRWGIAAIYAFGSRAEEIASMVRGEEVCPFQPQSDVDIGIEEKGFNE